LFKEAKKIYSTTFSTILSFGFNHSINSTARKAIINDNPFHEKELTKPEFETLLRKVFSEVKMFGQDLLVNGERHGRNWHNCTGPFEGIITDDDIDDTYGLLSICKK
jgi:hypothetical protein